MQFIGAHNTNQVYSLPIHIFCNSTIIYNHSNPHPMEDFIQALKQPSVLYLIFGILLAISPIVIKLVKWFWSVTKSEVKKEVVTELKKDNEVFKELMQDQMTVVKDAVLVMKKDNEVSHKHSEQMIDVMMMHIDELKHVKGTVENHEDRLIRIEKLKR